MAFADSLETGLPSGRIAHGLTTAWSIASRDDALETLDWLVNTGDRYIFDIVFRAYDETPGDDRVRTIAESLWNTGRYETEDAIQDDLATGVRMLACIDETYRTLKDPINGEYRAEHYRAGILAWDIGRLVTLARLCCDHGLIDAKERHDRLIVADAQLTTHFSSWPVFARSYVLGRAAKGGRSVALDGIIGIATDAMSDRKSPWLLSPL